jgi:hypothetical protein
MTSDQKKRELVRHVARLTELRLAEQQRKHQCSISPSLGPMVVAQRLRAERLPDGDQLEALAARLVDWALGLAPGAARPFSDADLDSSG